MLMRIEGITPTINQPTFMTEINWKKNRSGVRQIITGDTNLYWEVDEAWREFWLKRGRKVPPSVSRSNVGWFVIPGTAKFDELEKL